MDNLATLSKSMVHTARETEAFASGFALNGVHLPVHHDRTNCGSILDAEGNGIIVVDMHRERPDHQVMAIAELVVMAINARAGLIAEIA